MIRAVNIWMSKDVGYYEREVYGYLDLVGDIGGLFDGLSYLFIFFFSLLGLLGYDPLLDYLNSSLREQ